MTIRVTRRFGYRGSLALLLASLAVTGATKAQNVPVYQQEPPVSLPMDPRCEENPELPGCK